MSFRVKSKCLRAAGYQVATSWLLPVPCFFAFLAFSRIQLFLAPANVFCSNIQQPLLLFRTNVPAVMPTTSNFVYFSFLPTKQRDFPGNVRSGGCDSLPLVVAFTSKQHESPLSYALHFPSHNIPPNVLRWRKSGGCFACVCARARQSAEKSRRMPDQMQQKQTSGSVLL